MPCCGSWACQPPVLELCCGEPSVCGWQTEPPRRRRPALLPHAGRWRGAVVAVKIIESCVEGGKPLDLAREPLLSLSVSHPNVLSTFRLAVVCLQRGSLEDSARDSGCLGGALVDSTAPSCSSPALSLDSAAPAHGSEPRSAEPPLLDLHGAHDSSCEPVVADALPAEGGPAENTGGGEGQPGGGSPDPAAQQPQQPLPGPAEVVGLHEVLLPG